MQKRDRPKNLQEVLEIVLWANQAKSPLIPVSSGPATTVSSGPPRFNGDTVPSVANTFMVDLSGMK